MSKFSRICEQCNSHFESSYNAQRFCSRKCSNKGVPRRLKRINSKCAYDSCSNLVAHYSNRFCSSCILTGRHYMKKWDGNLISDLTIKEYCKRKGANKFDNIRARARAAIKLSGKELKCEDCGWLHHVEVCHIIPIHSFDPSTKVSIVNDLTNLKLLCPNCHWLFDHSC